ncbi:MAG: hypothetical protein KDC90_15890, partial [Ignavibacteriae bacterium]|nr:hypothetical protein [Ignavibacteriota bacterium]
MKYSKKLLICTCIISAYNLAGRKIDLVDRNFIPNLIESFSSAKSILKKSEGFLVFLDDTKWLCHDNKIFELGESAPRTTSLNVLKTYKTGQYIQCHDVAKAVQAFNDSSDSDQFIGRIFVDWDKLRYRDDVFTTVARKLDVEDTADKHKITDWTYQIFQSERRNFLENFIPFLFVDDAKANKNELLKLIIDNKEAILNGSTGLQEIYDSIKNSAKFEQNQASINRARYLANFYKKQKLELETFANRLEENKNNLGTFNQTLESVVDESEANLINHIANVIHQIVDKLKNLNKLPELLSGKKLSNNQTIKQILAAKLNGLAPLINLDSEFNDAGADINKLDAIIQKVKSMNSVNILTELQTWMQQQDDLQKHIANQNDLTMVDMLLDDHKASLGDIEYYIGIFDSLNTVDSVEAIRARVEFKSSESNIKFINYNDELQYLLEAYANSSIASEDSFNLAMHQAGIIGSDGQLITYDTFLANSTYLGLNPNVIDINVQFANFIIKRYNDYVQNFDFSPYMSAKIDTLTNWIDRVLDFTYASKKDTILPAVNATITNSLDLSENNVGRADIQNKLNSRIGLTQSTSDKLNLLKELSESIRQELAKYYADLQANVSTFSIDNTVNTRLQNALNNLITDNEEGEITNIVNEVIRDFDQFNEHKARLDELTATIVGLTTKRDE